MSITLGPTTTVTVARWTSQILAVALITQLPQAIVVPGALAKAFGLPLSSSATPEGKVDSTAANAAHPASLGTSSALQAARREQQWMTVYTARNAILGLIVLAFGYGQNNWKAVGTVCRLSILAPVVDMIVAGWQEGQLGKAGVHAATAAVIATLGYILG